MQMIKSTLRGVAQVMFQGNALSGALTSQSRCWQHGIQHSQLKQNKTKK